MGFWTFERMQEYIPATGCHVRTRLGPMWVRWEHPRLYGCSPVYSVGSMHGLDATQAVSLLDMLGAMPPKLPNRSESVADATT